MDTSGGSSRYIKHAREEGCAVTCIWITLPRLPIEMLTQKFVEVCWKITFWTRLSILLEDCFKLSHKSFDPLNWHQICSADNVFDPFIEEMFLLRNFLQRKVCKKVLMLLFGGKMTGLGSHLEFWAKILE